MAEVVNLNTFRKAKARADKQVRAQHNRVEHGTPKAFKNLEKAKRTIKDKALDGQKLDGDDDATPGR
ncbi:MAG: DUF4169 family protein [Magnetovibrio sp.]|nr:DUF4169 family protein [Magnetovibrio sp.]